MPAITALKEQRRRRDRVNVYLDGEYAFAVQDTVAAQLCVGQALSDEQIADLRRQDEGASAYERALHYLSYRPRSESEMRRYLSRRGCDEGLIGSILARLGRARLIDDEAFARYWIDNRHRFRPRGAWALRSELRQKGVANDVLTRALEDVDEDTEALNAATRAVRRFAHLDEATFRRRLLGFLRRRGFGYQTSRQVIDQLWSQTQARQEMDADC